MYSAKEAAKKYRQYTDEDIEWIKMIQCMRMVNIPIHSIKDYVSLLIQGGKTLEQRLVMVQNHMEDIKNKLESLSDIWIFLWYIGLPLLRKGVDSVCHR